MKPSEIFEGENSSLKKTYDEATKSKTLEEILEEFDERRLKQACHCEDCYKTIKNFVVYVFEQGCADGKEVYSKASDLARKRGYEDGVKDGMKGKLFNKVEIKEEVNIPKELHDKIFQAGKDSMREEIFDFIMKNLYNEQTCEKINEFFNKIK
jgi:hypothetical protein